MLRTCVKQAAMQDSATQNSCWKNPYSDVSVILFNDKKIYRVALLKIPQYDCTHLLRHRRKDIAAKCFCAR